MERNLRLYPFYQFFQNLLFWMPVFFLYFSSVLPIHQVLLLEGLYFLSVVILEVPSGYFSDRVGRRLTLLLSAAGWMAGSIIFCTTSTEAHAQTFTFTALALSALVGGIMAGFDLRWAYALSAIAGLAALAIAFKFVEPTPDSRQAHSPLTQILVVVRRLRDPVLRWLMVFVVAMTVLAHVPYEFYQPYLQFLFGGSDGGYTSTPAVAGVLTAIMMGIAAVASHWSLTVTRRLSPGGTLLAAVGMLLAIISAMSSVLHTSIMLVIVLRGVPMALTKPIIVSLTHPRLTGSVRATYLSVQSLAGRLAFSATLVLASLAVSDMEDLSVDGISNILMVYAVCTVVVLPVFVIGAIRLTRATGETRKSVPTSS